MAKFMSILVLILLSGPWGHAVHDEDDERVFFYSQYGHTALRLISTENESAVRFEICDFGAQLPGLIDNCRPLARGPLPHVAVDNVITALITTIHQEIQNQTPEWSTYFGWQMGSAALSASTTALMWWPPEWVRKSMPVNIPDLRRGMKFMGAISALGLAVDLFRVSKGLKAYYGKPSPPVEPARSLEQTLIENGVPTHAVKYLSPPITKAVISRLKEILTDLRNK